MPKDFNHSYLNMSDSGKDTSPVVESSSDDDEAETEAAFASLLTQLDDLENQQRQAIDVLRKSVRDAERVILKKKFSRQRKEIRKLKAAGPPSHNAHKKESPKAALVLESTPAVTLAGESTQEEDIVMGGDDHGLPSESPTALVAPPTEVAGARKVSKGLEFSDIVGGFVGEERTEKAAEVPVMPRGFRPNRARMKGGRINTTSRPPADKSLIGTSSSSRNINDTRRGTTTARRSKLKGNSVTSRPGFVAVNTPQPPPGADPSAPYRHDTPLSALPAGAIVSRPLSSSSTRPLPSNASPIPSTPSISSRKALKGHQKQLPTNPVLFSSKDLRAIFGGGNPGHVIVKVTEDGQLNSVVKYVSYICLTPEAHFDPPGTMCDNAAMLDIHGQEDPLDSEIIYPVWRKVRKMWLYCGDYTLGKRDIVPVNSWKDSSEVVKKYWAKKLCDTEWGREFLVRKGFRRHGEIRHNTVPEVMGYFALADNRQGLRLSATLLNFKTFDYTTYEAMVAKAETLNPAGLQLVHMGTLQSNNLAAGPHTSLLAAGAQSPDLLTSLHQRKRRRIQSVGEGYDDEGGEGEEGEEGKKQEQEESERAEESSVASYRRLVTGSARGRRTSRNAVNYRIAPLSEFTAELERTGDDIIQLSEGEDVASGDGDTAEGEGELEGVSESESEGEMRID